MGGTRNEMSECICHFEGFHRSLYFCSKIAEQFDVLKEVYKIGVVSYKETSKLGP